VQEKSLRRFFLGGGLASREKLIPVFTSIPEVGRCPTQRPRLTELSVDYFPRLPLTVLAVVISLCRERISKGIGANEQPESST
jgi:hypothetical protein